jgi:fructose-specific phosphotransferase system IIC component
MNWFERHLNWTLILGTIGSLLAAFIASFIVGIIFYNLPDKDVEGIATLINIPIISIGTIITIVWVLRHKNRSLWWLLMAFVPFGYIVWLCLKNKNYEY